MIEVSVIIPCRNEEKFIGKCLDSLIKQDYQKDILEVLIIDGDSEDETKNIVEKYSKKHLFIKLLDNPNKYTPFGLNIGIKAATGEIIVRMDAHAGYNSDYLSKCVKNLRESGADNVGGVIKTLPSKNTVWSKSIASVLSNRFGAGFSYFRIGSDKPRWVDTVFGGCYKKSIFEKIGMFNEKLIRGQDIELNKRLKEAGGKILLAPDIIATYFPQSTFFGFLKHNFIDGYWTIYPLKFNIKLFSSRHLIPLFFFLALFGGFLLSLVFGFGKILFFSISAIYVLANLFFSLEIIVKNESENLLSLMITFFNRHFFYGLGSFWGIIILLINKYGRKKTKRN
ncbi:MAG: glycosyltransferase family 2 protein [bacterium]